MPKFETKFSKYFNLPNPGLRSYFDIVRRGQPDEYRTPFYRNKELSSILKGWNNTLVQIKDEWPELYEFEIGLSKKVGPMSIMKPLEARMDDIEAYYSSISKDGNPIDSRAINAVIDEWAQVAGLRIRGQDRTVEVMKKSTNSGSPYFTKRRNVISKTLPCIVSLTSDGVIQNLPSGSYGACAVLGWRGQEGGPRPSDTKQRVVWMFPFSVNVAELQVYQPMIEACQRFNLVPAWVSMDAVDRRMTELFDTKGSDDLLICTDFSKFDQHFNKYCQDAAMLIISELFTDNIQTQAWLSDVYPIKYHIPLAYDWDKLKFGPHGMGSGSGGTNADETCTHRALQHEAAILRGQKLNPNSQCLGDDGVLSYPKCNVEDVMHAYTSHGLEMNPDKQYVSTHDATYLRRWYHQNYRVDNICRGVYSTMRALGRLAEQERYYDPETWGKEMVTLRYLSIIENVKWHPLCNAFADYCIKGDKYGLGLYIPGFLDNIVNIAQEAIDNMPDFLGYTKSMQKDNSVSGIKDWWIIHYLQSKR